ncbi:MAG: FGGY-family carbohydrate kinase [Devosiaceae bacterium]|nr:FGGY-family carbohydrate kinase [Devosiaceae bacterium MH13]
MLVLGIDIGTSGVRTAVLDEAGTVISTARAPHTDDANHNAEAWWQAVTRTLEAQVEALRQAGHDPKAIARLAVDGTSGTMVLIDEALEPVTPALMYNSSGFEAEAITIAQHVEPASIARGSSSALARMLRLQALDGAGRGRHLLHQADYALAKLAGGSLGSDDNNALKLGWDPEARAWPHWFADAGVRMDLLPDIEPPGTPVGTIAPAIAELFGLSTSLQLHAGTTDSVAAFLASGASQVGEGVTSLGTTLAIKLLSDVRIDDAPSGIYSHKVQGMWLAGGASNTGGGVLASLFGPDDLARLSAQIDPQRRSELDYYPLLQPGERFPVNDPALAPRMTPRPADDAQYLHGLLESIGRIEASGYAKLRALGAPRVTRVLTAGGGAKNAVWTQIRQRLLGVPVVQTEHVEAAIGAARLCLKG